MSLASVRVSFAAARRPRLNCAGGKFTPQRPALSPPRSVRALPALSASRARLHARAALPLAAAHVPQLLSPPLLALTCKATFKLGLICVLVATLTRSGTLPADMPQSLSKLAFNVTIPCMLVTKTAETLARTAGDWTYLMVPVAAMIQVACGVVLGHFASAWAVHGRAHNNTRAADAIAQSVAQASGMPMLAGALVAPPATAPPGTRAIVQTACAFGNSLTLPLLYLLTLFSDPVGGSAVTGFTALVLLGWSPLFWSYGYAKLTNAMRASLSDAPDSSRGLTISTAASPAARVRWRSRDDAAPPGGGLIGVGQLEPSQHEPAPPRVDVTDLPQDMRALPGLQDLSASGGEEGAEFRVSGARAAAQYFKTLSESGSDSDLVGASVAAPERAAAAGSDPDDAPVTRSASAPAADEQPALFYMTPIADPTAKPEIKLPLLDPKKRRDSAGRWQSRLLDGVQEGVQAAEPAGKPGWLVATLDTAKRTLNPPFVAAIVGLVLGLCPLGGVLFAPTLSTVLDLVAHLPWELEVLLATARSAGEVATLLGSATLVLQAVTLGASLIPKRKSASLRSVLVPATRWEWRQLVATGVVRLLLMPLVGLASVHHLSRWGLLPASAACKMALLVQSCMPSAQNLVLMVNLREETKEMAPAMAQMLLRQYLLAVVPTTVWISVFMAYVGGF